MPRKDNKIYQNGILVNKSDITPAIPTSTQPINVNVSVNWDGQKVDDFTYQIVQHALGDRK